MHLIVARRYRIIIFKGDAQTGRSGLQYVNICEDVNYMQLLSSSDSIHSQKWPLMTWRPRQAQIAMIRAETPELALLGGKLRYFAHVSCNHSDKTLSTRPVWLPSTVHNDLLLSFKTCFHSQHIFLHFLSAFLLELHMTLRRLSFDLLTSQLHTVWRTWAAIDTTL